MPDSPRNVAAKGAAGLLAALPDEARPVVVFVTAHDHFAIQAFEANAVDYVLKPFSPVELAARVRRLLKRGRGSGWWRAA